MTLELYVCTSERNRLSKVLTGGVSLAGTLREESSITDPVILLEGGSLAGYNYAYIPDFGRYYYINDMTSVRSRLWRASLHVDVLMSFSDSIRGVPCIVSASTRTGADVYLEGSGQWVAKVKEMTQIKTFPQGLPQEGEFILITAGG